MLLVWEVTSASDAKNYYGSSVSPGASRSRQDYYSEGQEVAGRYGGKLAERLGLNGKSVDRESFERLCDNLNPTPDDKGRLCPLTPRTNDKRRVAYDLTFSAPKSFSIIEALASDADRQALLQAFDASINETIAEDIEPDMMTRVRKDGADHDIVTGNVLTAGFDHATARPVAGLPPDMQRHRHVLVWNATWSPAENRVKAGQFGTIVRDKAYYEAAFYARLGRKLEEQGYAIDRREGGSWEIAGIPQALIERFSKRTDQIEDEAVRLGITDAAQKGGLGAKTRGRKEKDLTMSELRQAWVKQLSDADRDALVRVYGRQIPANEPITASQAVGYSLKHCLERSSVVPERELKRVALLYGLGSVTPEQIAAELPRHDVITGEKDGRRMATTRAVYLEERFITAFAANGRGTVTPIGVAPSLERGKLDDDQWNAVIGLLTSHDRVSLVDSAAGVGKSTMLSTFDQGMRLAGRHVTYLATTTPAVGVLQGDGFAAETVAKFLLSEKMQEAAKGGTVVIDESSMLGHRDAYRLFQLARDKDLRLVYLGDSRQHASVAAGSFMKLIREFGGITPFRIAEIKRQKTQEHKEAVREMFEGRTAAGFDKLDGLGWVKEIGDDGARYQAMAAEYVQALKDGTTWDQLLLISPTHKEGEQVTAAIRQLLKEEGLIGKDDQTLTRWVASDLTEAERGDARNYRPGKVDMVQFHQNAKGFKSGTRLEIAAGPAVPYDQSAKFQAFRKESVDVAVGDILRFTANGTTLDNHKIRNGSAYKIAGFTAKGIRLENGWVVSRDFGHWRQGIETSFGSQSKTVSHAIVGQSSRSFAASNMEQAYVSASRAKHKVTFYTDDKAGLRQAIQRSSLKLAAHDLVPTLAPVRPSLRTSWRQRLAHWRRLALLGRNRADHATSTPQHQIERQVTHGRGR